jgi:hypothetical protein
MENVAHWTQQSTGDFVYNISSTFVAQIETKMEEDKVSRSELANRLNKTTGRVSQILNNPGNLSLRVMVETAQPLGMKVSVIAYDDDDPGNGHGPIDPDVFVKCWERAGRPANLFEVEDAFTCPSFENYTDVMSAAFPNLLAGQIYGMNIPTPQYIIAEPNPSMNFIEPAKILSGFEISMTRFSSPSTDHVLGTLMTASPLNERYEPWLQQSSAIPQEKVA